VRVDYEGLSVSNLGVLFELLLVLETHVRREQPQRARCRLASAGPPQTEHVLRTADHQLLLRREFELDLWDPLDQPQQLLGAALICHLRQNLVIDLQKFIDLQLAFVRQSKLIFQSWVSFEHFGDLRVHDLVSKFDRSPYSKTHDVFDGPEGNTVLQVEGCNFTHCRRQAN